MKFTLKVEGRDLGKCATCSNRSSVGTERGTRHYCTAWAFKGSNGPPIPLRNDPVTECTEYHEKGKPGLLEMQNHAWLIDTDRLTKKIGFVKPSKRSHAQGEALERQMEALPEYD